MKKLAQAAVTSQALSVAAMEETSRMGQREADLEHLLLALTINEQAAGQVLRGQGVTLEKARGAISEMRTLQLQSIGVSADAPMDGRITYHETKGYEWSGRAREVLARSVEGGKAGDAAAVLRELLKEPSGSMVDLLQHMGASPAALLDSLDALGRGPAAPLLPHTVWGRDGAGTIRSFVPAPVEKVWALLVQPAGMAQWEPFTGSTTVAAGSGTAAPGDAWLTSLPAHWPQGKPVRVRKGYERRRVELLAADPEANIAWRFSYPNAPQSNCRELAIALTSVPGGSQLDITLALKSGGWRRMLGLLLTPMRRFSLRLQLRHIAGGIGRAFR